MQRHSEEHLQKWLAGSRCKPLVIRGARQVGSGMAVQGLDTLLFLGEIQATPHALQALRYLYEDRPDIPVVAKRVPARIRAGRSQFLAVGRPQREIVIGSDVF